MQRIGHQAHIIISFSWNGIKHIFLECRKNLTKHRVNTLLHILTVYMNTLFQPFPFQNWSVCRSSSNDHICILYTVFCIIKYFYSSFIYRTQFLCDFLRAIFCSIPYVYLRMRETLVNLSLSRNMYLCNKCTKVYYCTTTRK